MASFTYAEPVPDSVVEQLSGYSPLTRQLLHQRGVSTKEAAATFLSPSYDTGLHDPWLLHDMKPAVDRLTTAFKESEKIAIYSDYDCDGIPGAVVLTDLLQGVGHENYTTYIPHRHYEGFGLSVSAVEKLAEEKVSLIVTIDCGTTDVAAVEKASELGVDVIITDHHQPGEQLPPAVAIVNPQLGDYPFKGLCGAAVIFKVAQAVLDAYEHTLAPGQEKWWLDMVGLATVADMVPLTDENRVFAHFGLRVLQKTRRPGLQALLSAQRVHSRYLTEDDIGFTIGPRINAASRMDAPEDAYQMLVAKEADEAGELSRHLEQLNNERKGVVAAMTKESHKKMKQFETVPAVIVIGNPDWRPSLVGLVANKLAEEHGRPAFVWGRDGNGVLKGSARSGGTANVHHIMNQAPEAFTEYGGHFHSGGFSVKEEQIHDLPALLVKAYETLDNPTAGAEALCIDSTLHIDTVTQSFVRDLAQLAPYGKDNPKPLFKFERVVPKQVSLFGKTKEHTKLEFDTKGMAREAIAFFVTPEQFTLEPREGAACHLIGHVEQSFFMGRLQTRVRIIDVLPV